MPRNPLSKKQNRYHLQQAKAWQAEQQTMSQLSAIGSSYQFEPTVSRYGSKAAIFISCMMLLSTVIAAMPQNSETKSGATPQRNRNTKPTKQHKSAIYAVIANPLKSSEFTCQPAPSINPTNTLTIYHASTHFFVELICNGCDNGQYYADRHGIQPEFRPYAQKHRDNTNTVRDEYFNAEHDKIVAHKITLSDKNAVQTLEKIRSLHGQFNSKQKQYELFNFNCIDYVQTVYAAAGGKGYFTHQLGCENLFGLAGAVAYFKQNNIFSSLFKMMFILMNDPLHKLESKDFPNLHAEKPCLLYDVRRSKPLYYDSFFSQKLAYCKTTPVGEQVPSYYHPPLEPICKVYRGVCIYSDGLVAPGPKTLLLEKLEPLIPLMNFFAR